jgi:hypothetical protein
MAENESTKDLTPATAAVLRLAPHVGAFILAFSIIDVQIAKITSYVYPRCEAEGINLKFHKDLSKKIGQIRRGFSEAKSLRKWKLEMLDILREVDAMKPARDMLSHGGIAANHAHLDMLVFEKVNPTLDGSAHIQELMTISKEDLRQVAQNALSVAARLLTVVREMFSEDGSPA